MKQTSLIAISTPQESGNYYSELFEIKDAAGQPFFETVKIGMACKACIKAGTAETCTHPTPQYTPPWQGEDRDLLMASLYGNRKDLLARETRGLITSDNDTAWDHDSIDAFFERRVPISTPLQLVLTACDPNGGGDSELALLSVAMQRGMVVVVAVETAKARGFDDIKSALTAHITRLLREHPSAIVCFAPENNLGNEAAHMAHMLRKIARVHTIVEPGKAQIHGVRTTQERKKLYVGEIERCFACESIAFAQRCLMTGSARDSFKAQMKAYKKIKRTNVKGQVSISYSGKGSGNDDLAVCIGMGVYWLMQKVQRRA